MKSQHNKDWSRKLDANKREEKRRLLKYVTKIIQEKTIQMVRNKIITDVDEGKVYEKGNQMTGQANFFREI